MPIKIRLLWLMLSTLAISICFYLIFKLIEIYLKYEVVTTFKLGYDISTFPTITLCNTNFFNTPNGRKCLDEALLSYSKSDISKSDTIGKIKDIELRLDYVRATLFKNKTIYTKKELIKSFGLTLKDMMLSCNFGSKPCNETNFEYFFDITLGNCYRFNHGRNESIRKVITGGDTSGLQLALYLGNQSINRLSYSNGIYLSINNKSFRSILPNYGFNIPTGRVTNIGFKRKFYEKLDAPYSDCIKNKANKDSYYSELFKKTIDLAGVYSKTFCFKICVI